MFTRQIDEDISTRLAIPYYAEALYSLTDHNRDHLRRWLAWVDATTCPEHTRGYLTSQLECLARGEGFCEAIFWRNQLVGVADYHEIDAVRESGLIGYWLCKEHTGRGIMTRVVEDLIHLGREFFGLRRIEIRCASENHASRAIPNRLGFRHEGCRRQAEVVNGQWFDMEIYALVR